VRRIVLTTAAAVAAAGLFVWLRPAGSEINQVTEVSPGVYFHEGDLHGHGHCNNAWIVFDDYVLVVDANFPSGARLVIPKIKGATDKPIRFAFDTHHHGDHAYGNQVWVEEGAIPVAHTGVIDEMKKYETGYYGSKPGRWEDAAKSRPDVAASKLKPPTLLYPDRMIFDDGKRRLELRHFGVAHTHGDGWGWMPKERILFSGDACVNGPFNYVGDGDTGKWIKTLEAAQKLNPRVVVPGHGPVADGSLLEDQRQYFLALRREVKKLVDAKKAPAEVRSAFRGIRSTIEAQPRIKKYVGDFFNAQCEKVYQELGGRPLPPMAARAARARHALDHQSELLMDAPTSTRRVARRR
jgi:glyoxylase-like metal-dependent hydrolase (beta-lactamase superfamily II)